jgi:signal transduction histidine kinase
MKESTLLTQINNVSLKFLSPLSPEQTFKVIADEGMGLVNGEYASILLKTRNGLDRVYQSSEHFSRTLPRKNGFTYKVYKTGKPKVLTEKETNSAHPELSKMGIKSIFLIPLSYEGKSLGVLTIQCTSSKRNKNLDKNLLKLFGSMSSLAIRKSQLYDETEKALKMRDRFISMAAHELKTPLTTISGYIQLLDGKIKDTQFAEARWIDQLSYESQRLTNLVNELLQVNRIKSGQLQYQWSECDIKEILRRAIQGFRFKFPHKILFFNDQVHRQINLVIGDFDKLLQVFTNILDNAAKFSDENTPVLISLQRKNGCFQIEIEDSGKGIDKKDLEHVFEEYYKAAKTETIQGMGLGLFLVKNIIDEHQGEIRVSSKLDHGTVVRIKLKEVEI